MSLIDEALKRAQAAEAADRRPEPGARPWTPAPLPDRGRIRRRKAIRAALALAFVALAGLGALLLLRRSPERTSAFLPMPTAPPVKEGLPSTAPAKEGLPSVASAKEGLPETRPGSAVRIPTAPAGVASIASPSVPAPAPPSTAPDRPATLVDAKTYVGSVTLPGGARIELGGIVYSESNPTALVNGKIVGPGAVVEGFLIQRIEENRVEMSNSEGLTIYIALPDLKGDSSDAQGR